MQVSVAEQKEKNKEGVGVLKPLVRPVRAFHRFAGFPITAEVDMGTLRFSLDKRTYALYIVLLSSAMLCFVVQYVIFFANGIGLRDLFELITKAGLVMTDSFAAQILYLSCMGLNLSMTYFFKGLDQKLTDFNTNMDSMDVIIISREDCNRLFKKKALRGVLAFAMAIVASVISTIGLTIGFQPGLGNGPVLWVVAILQFIAFAMVLCPPVNLLVHVVTTYSMESVHQTLVNYIKKLKLTKTEGARNVVKEIEVGFRLEETVKHVNDMLAGFLVIEFTTTAMVQICSIYFSMGLVEALVKQQFELAAVLFASQAIVCAVMSAMLRIDLIFTGDKICVAYRSIKRLLQDILKHSHQDLNESTKLELEILLERFTNVAPISPFGSFSVNLSSSISLDAIIITYIIVLLQFRLSG